MNKNNSSNGKKIIIKASYVQRLGEKDVGKEFFGSFDNFFENYFIELSRNKFNFRNCDPYAYAWEGTEGMCFCPHKGFYVSRIDLIKKSFEGESKKQEKEKIEEKDLGFNINFLNYFNDGNGKRNVYFDMFNGKRKYIIYFNYNSNSQL